MDSYQYQVWDVPRPEILGSQAYRTSQFGATSPQTFQPSGSIYNPFTTPSSPGTPGEGGGGGPVYDCASEASIGTLNTTQVALPCASNTSLLTAAALALSSGGGTAEFSAVNGRIVISLGGKTITIDSAVPSGDVAFREFSNCNGQTWWALATEPA